MLEVVLRHLQHIVTISQEHVASVAVFSHILILTFLKRFQFFRVVALYPACLIKADRFPTALSVVFIFQTILYNLKLKLTYSTGILRLGIE